MDENYDDLKLSRLRNELSVQGTEWEEKRMFGGQCFMVDDKMCFGTFRGGLMARVGAEQVAELQTQEGIDQMIHNNRAMKDYIFAEEFAFESDGELAEIIKCCLEFNPKAKSSKRKKK